MKSWIVSRASFALPPLSFFYSELFFFLRNQHLLRHRTGNANNLIAVDSLIGRVFFPVPTSQNINFGIRFIRENSLERGAAVREREIIGFTRQNAFPFGRIETE